MYILLGSALLEYSKTFGNVMQPQLSKIIRVLSASLHENLSYTQSDDITGKDKTAGLTHHLHANSETISTIIKVTKLKNESIRFLKLFNSDF